MTSPKEGRVLTAPAEDLGSVPDTHVLVYSCLSFHVQVIWHPCLPSMGAACKWDHIPTNKK